MTDFRLRALTAEDEPDLQRLYEDAPAALVRLLGRPAQPGQAARDLAQAAATRGRYQLGAVLDGQVIGMVDCKLSDETPGLAYIGLLLLADRYADPDLAGTMVRMVSRWLAAAFDVGRLEASVLAHHAPDIAFWRSLGFEFTGQQYRRELPGYAPRFLVLARDLDA